MIDGIELVREGMKKGGVPPSLISAAETAEKDEAIAKRIKFVDKLLDEKTKSLLILLGDESPGKELIAARVMRTYMLKKNKTGLWLTPPKVPISYSEGVIPTSGITVITGMDLLSPFQINSIGQLMRDRLPTGAVFILMLQTEGVFDGLFDTASSSRDYFKHYAVMFEFESPKIEVSKA